eukprot:TRINITY_DN10076_c0_g1_i1.p1 TRINITY_DN10076_c0_g1~~TRINITY_DN10076_c0_g1_i1.p1  ORF type:complete len:142 (-),score=27.69 TRINITY_DN10076_c0_g1_i1:85-510(-)
MLRTLVARASRSIFSRSETSTQTVGVRILTPSFETSSPLKYPLQELKVTSPTGHMPPIGNTTSLPFKVERTNTGQLPVYSDIRNGRTNILTIVRRVTGDLNEMKAEVEKLTGSLVQIKTGKLEIKGPHTKKVKLWLRHLGY